MVKACRFTGSHECSVSPSDTIEHRDFIAAHHYYWRLLCVPPSLGILSFRTVFYSTSYVVLSDVDVHISFVGLSLLTYR